MLLNKFVPFITYVKAAAESQTSLSASNYTKKPKIPLSEDIGVPNKMDGDSIYMFTFI